MVCSGGKAPDEAAGVAAAQVMVLDRQQDRLNAGQGQQAVGEHGEQDMDLESASSRPGA